MNNSDKVIHVKIEDYTSLLYSIIKLEEIINDNKIEDDIAGDVILADSNKIFEYTNKLKNKASHVIENMAKTSIRYKELKPLVDAVDVMNKINYNGKRNINESETSDRDGAIDLGETLEQATSGGAETEEGGDRCSTI